MYKRFLLKCDIYNHYKGWWEENTELYFDTKEEMIDFIKNGTDYIRPQDIRVQAAFELNKIGLNLN